MPRFQLHSFVPGAAWTLFELVTFQALLMGAPVLCFVLVLNLVHLECLKTWSRMVAANPRTACIYIYIYI